MNCSIIKFVFLIILNFKFQNFVYASNKSDLFLLQNPVFLFWNDLNQKIFNELNVTQNCRYALEFVIKGLYEGQTWSYQSKFQNVTCIFKLRNDKIKL